MKTTAIIGAFILTLTVPLLASDATAGALSGSVKTTTGKPVRAAVTLHDLSTARIQGQQPFDRQFASKSDGTFAITGVPPGKYQVCVDAPQENVLDPCKWSSAPPVVTLPSEANVTGLAVKVETGYMLRVHVNDPAAMLSMPKGGIAGDALSIRVITRTNQHMNFRLLGAAALSRDHYLLVPFDQQLTLAVESSALALSNGNDQRYSGDAVRIPVRVPGGGSLPPITMNVSPR